MNAGTQSCKRSRFTCQNFLNSNAYLVEALYGTLNKGLNKDLRKNFGRQFASQTLERPTIVAARSRPGIVVTSPKISLRGSRFVVTRPITALFLSTAAVARYITSLRTLSSKKSGQEMENRKVSDQADSDGRFHRQVSSFRHKVQDDPQAKFPAEKGRYHLFVSYACPWASRTLIVRELKGLQDVIPVWSCAPMLDERGWDFREAKGTPGIKTGFIKDLYMKTQADYNKRFTVPVLWDAKNNVIVNNESSEIIRMMNDSFDSLIALEYRGLTFYPNDLQEKIDGINEWVYDTVNNGVYKAGFATTQKAYEENVYPLFESLDKIEKILSENGPFLLGGTLTEADIRLYTTIVRFDVVYVQHFKCNLKMIRFDYPHIHRWLQNLYFQNPGFAETTKFDQIKEHYMQSHHQINPHGIVAVGPKPDIIPIKGGNGSGYETLQL